MFIQEKWVTWSCVGGAGVPTIMRGTVMSYYFINVVKISCRSILSFKFVDKIYISHMSILIFTKIWISKMKVCSMQLHSIYIYSTFRSFNLLSLSFLLSFDTNSSTNTSLLAHPSICRSFFSSHIFFEGGYYDTGWMTSFGPHTNSTIHQEHLHTNSIYRVLVILYDM